MTGKQCRCANRGGKARQIQRWNLLRHLPNPDAHSQPLAVILELDTGLFQRSEYCRAPVTASFWRRVRLPVSRDEGVFDRVFEVRMLANEILGVDEHDRILTAPKLLAKSRAMSANSSDVEVFRVRAISAQIGWLETSMADAVA
jgi:hypothetical protein